MRGHFGRTERTLSAKYDESFVERPSLCDESFSVSKSKEKTKRVRQEYECCEVGTSVLISVWKEE